MNRKLYEHLLNHIDSYYSASEEEVFRILGAEAAVMVGFEQGNPHHCYDLWKHTLHTVEALGADAPNALKAAAFFHDIGKPDVASYKDDRQVFYGHPAKSASYARLLLQQMGFAKGEIDEICFYVAHHDDFISWILPEEAMEADKRTWITRKNVVNHMRRTTHLVETDGFHLEAAHWKNLLRLCMADVEAQADIVVFHGVQVDSKEHKQRKYRQILKYIAV